MRSLLAILLLISESLAHAGNCDLVSGTFVANGACPAQRLKIDYNNQIKNLSISVDDEGLDAAGRQTGYRLIYIADGQEQIGRHDYEGDKYVASCADNHIRLRGFWNVIRPALLNDYSIDGDGSLVFRQSFEGSVGKLVSGLNF
jgi:hypothetical protein